METLPVTAEAEFRRRQVAYYQQRQDVIVPASFQRYLSKRMDALRPHLQSASSILDLCCGHGYLGQAAAQLDTGRTKRVWGVDLSHERLRSAQTRGLKTARGDAARLPFRSEAFDAVIVGECIHHIPRSERNTTLAELMRVLRPGGSALLIEPSPYHPLILALGVLLEADRGVFGFSIRRTVGGLRSAGAAQVTVRPFNCFTYPSRHIWPDAWRPWFYAAEDLLEQPVLAMSRLIVATKRWDGEQHTERVVGEAIMDRSRT